MTHFTRPLPPGRDQLLRREPMGSVVKVNAVYSTPFWRATGLNGAATSDTGPIRITHDNSPPAGKPGVLVGFMEGNASRRFYGVPRAAPRHAARQSFCALDRPIGAVHFASSDLSAVWPG